MKKVDNILEVNRLAKVFFVYLPDDQSNIQYKKAMNLDLALKKG